MTEDPGTVLSAMKLSNQAAFCSCLPRLYKLLSNHTAMQQVRLCCLPRKRAPSVGLTLLLLFSASALWEPVDVRW